MQPVQEIYLLKATTSTTKIMDHINYPIQILKVVFNFHQSGLCKIPLSRSPAPFFFQIWNCTTNDWILVWPHITGSCCACVLWTSFLKKLCGQKLRSMSTQASSNASTHSWLRDHCFTKKKLLVMNLVKSLIYTIIIQKSPVICWQIEAFLTFNCYYIGW